MRDDDPQAYASRQLTNTVATTASARPADPRPIRCRSARRAAAARTASTGSTREAPERLPALERRHQLVFDLGAALGQRGGALRVRPVQAAVGQRVVDFALLLLQRVDQARQRFELALFLVVQLPFL